MHIMAENHCIVNTKEGPVCGYIDKTDEGTFYRFKGIPYALPPIKQLRFSPPSPAKPWTEIKDCTKEANIPISLGVNDDIVGSEDCLYIEVTSPCIKPERPLPVMFWIGGFIFVHLAEHMFDHSLLVKEDIVFVRCGYRQGPFGFLSCDDFMAPGNCGLKDIVLALKWVRNNIAEFGGDPHNVTTFGSSSGGAIVHLLMLSPMATDLFHKAIIQSASALNQWSLVKSPLQSTMKLANELGIKQSHVSDILEELKAVTAEKIMQGIVALHTRAFDSNRNFILNPLFRPCIEHDFEGQPAFLTKNPSAIIKSGNFNKVPLIIGSNNIEASIVRLIKDDFYNFETFNENLNLIVPMHFDLDISVSKQIGQQLLKFYLDGEEYLRKDTCNQYLQLLTDYHFLYYIHKTVQLHNEHAPECPVYYYVVNQTGEWSVPPDMNVFNASGHFSEMPFIFGLKVPNASAICRGSRDSVQTRRRVIKMWTNFAKYGDPTPDEDDKLLHIKWDPVENKDKMNYMSIGSELTKGRNPFLERMNFWEELHRNNPFLRVLVLFQDLGVAW